VRLASRQRAALNAIGVVRPVHPQPLDDDGPQGGVTVLEGVDLAAEGIGVGEFGVQVGEVGGVGGHG